AELHQLSLLGAGWAIASERRESFPLPHRIRGGVGCVRAFAQRARADRLPLHTRMGQCRDVVSLTFETFFGSRSLLSVDLKSIQGIHMLASVPLAKSARLWRISFPALVLLACGGKRFVGSGPSPAGEPQTFFSSGDIFLHVTGPQNGPRIRLALQHLIP